MPARKKKEATPQDLAKSRAAHLLKLPTSAIEDDLVEFLSRPDGDILLRARAGSGKTTALAIKVAHLIQDLGAAPEEVLMLTFNNAAARSIEARLGEYQVPEGVKVRTFHAYGQRIVRAHFGGSRRAIFEEEGEDAKLLAEMMQDSIDEVINERYFHWCAGRMRMPYDKRRDYVESIGRDALISAVNFLRTRGYGLQNPFKDAWDVGGPIAANAMKVIMAYEGRLKDARLLDATAVLQAASWTLERELSTGVARPSEAHGLNWIFVDEFQDMSAPFMRLITATRNLNGTLNVQGVGDDWQAINGFAGSHLDHFSNVSDHLEDPVQLDLLRNRRCGASIVEWGNAVMRRAGYPEAPAIPHPANGDGEVSRSKISAKRDLTYAVQQLAKLVRPDVKEVALIARKWKVGDYGLLQFRNLLAAEMKTRGQDIKVVGITAHGSKGLEYDQVLLLDDGSFPLEHPSRPLLASLIPEQDYLREEACLKHVAGTRARKRLDVVDMT